MLGSTPNIDKMTRPNKPNVDVETIFAASGAEMGVCTACTALDMAAVEASTRDVTAMDAAMITTVVGGQMRGPNVRKSPNAVLRKSTVAV